VLVEINNQFTFRTFAGLLLHGHGSGRRRFPARQQQAAGDDRGGDTAKNQQSGTVHLH